MVRLRIRFAGRLICCHFPGPFVDVRCKLNQFLNTVKVAGVGFKSRACMIVILFIVGLSNFLTCFASAQQKSSRVQSAFETFRGQHITLVTDLESADEARSLVATLDAAADQWRLFWQLPEDALADWQIKAFVMRDKAAFERAGMIPARVPAFQQGYAFGNSIFVLAQPSPYYTRHLLLHEAVHALAFAQFDGAGPSWFMEGVAELLATHRESGAKVKTNRIPISRQSVPHWGRLTLIEDARKQKAIPRLETVMRYPQNLNADAERYAWCWAAVMLLSNYDEYHPEFQSAARRGRESGPQFTKELYARMQQQWPVISARWRLLCESLGYGYDFSRERVNLLMSHSRWDGSEKLVSVDSTRGWQSAGVRIPAGASFSISATGRVQIAMENEPWMSEPTGVTIRYANERPLGQCLACFVPVKTTIKETLDPLKIFTVDAQKKVTANQESWLVFRVNDLVGELLDNEGSYQIRMHR